jgi:hypothetical protein
MKKTIYALLACCMLNTGVMAQLDKNRTTSTRIADLLAQLPADNAAQLKKSMDELAELGKPGLVQIASMLVAPGKGDDAKAQFALGGFTYYAAQAGKEALRKMAAEAYVDLSVANRW